MIFQKAKKQTKAIKALSQNDVISVVSVQQNPNSDDNNDDIFEIELPVLVDKSILAGQVVDKIDISVQHSAEPLANNKNSLTIEKEKLTSAMRASAEFGQDKASEMMNAEIKAVIGGKTKFKENPTLLNRSIGNALSNKKSNSNQQIKNKKIGSTNFTPSTNMLNVKKANAKEVFGVKKTLTPMSMTQKEIEAKNANKKIDSSESDENDFRNIFKKQYRKLLSSGVKDTAVIFQEPHNKTSLKQKHNGLLAKPSPNAKNNLNIFNPVVEGIKKEIKDISLDRNIKFVSSLVSKSSDPLKVKVKISRKDLNNLSRKGAVILQAKDKKGGVSQASRVRIDVDKLLSQEKLSSTDFSMGVKRTEKGSGLLIGSNKKADSSLSIFKKTVSKSSSATNSDFVRSNDIKIGKDSNRKNIKTRTKPADDVFYRGTLNFAGEDYSNMKCTVDRSNKRKFENIPLLSINARIDHKRDCMSIHLNNISTNISSIKIMKQRFKGHSGLLGDKINILDSKKMPIDYIFVQGESTLSLCDYDMFDEKSYRYYAECIMSNGELKTCHSSFIETFEEKSEIVKFSNVETNVVNGVIDVNFVLEKIQTDTDAILGTLFGDLFLLFQKDLENIKDLQGLVYSVEVVRINSQTGESKTIERLSLNDKGEGSFQDKPSDVTGVFYKLIPRVIPASDIIAKVNDKIELIGKKQVFKKLNSVFASNRRTGKDIRNTDSASGEKKKIISKVGSKFSNRMGFKKGRIVTPQSEIEESGMDFFKHSSTGDIFYIDVINEKNGGGFKMNKGVVKDIPNFKSKFKNEDKKGMQKQYSSIDIKVSNDKNVDYYQFYVKENNDVYLDGVVNSTDSSGDKNYKYLVSHKGSIGDIEYFAVPVFKTGEIGSVKSVGKRFIK